jgi:perosamine synthetase
MSCAVGLQQLKKIDYILSKRRQIAAKYTDRLKGVEGIITPYIDSVSESSWWVYYLRLEDNLDRDKILNYLNANGISARAYFDPPIHLQPIYKKLFGYRGGEFLIAEKVSRSGFIIPFFVGLRDEEIEKVCTVISEAVRRA